MAINAVPASHSAVPPQRDPLLAQTRTREPKREHKASENENVDRSEISTAVRELARELADNPHLQLSVRRLRTLASGREQSGK